MYTPGVSCLAEHMQGGVLPVRLANEIPLKDHGIRERSAGIIAPLVRCVGGG